jgi:DNA relaxase NicK
LSVFKLDRLNLTVDENFSTERKGIENLALSIFGYVPEVTESRARHYPRGWSIGSEGVVLAFVACGASHRRCMVEITGRGCDRVDVGAVYHFARANMGSITRLDAAYDYAAGYTILDALADAKAGKFRNAQRNRKNGGVAEKQTIERAGTWDFSDDSENTGRTIYVRSPAYEICIYEKGIKDGGPREWVRVEVRAKKLAMLGLDAIRDVRSVWLKYAGALMPDEKSNALPVLKRAQTVSQLATRIRQARLMAGRLIADFRASGMSDADICELLRGSGGEVIGSDVLKDARIVFERQAYEDGIPF